MSKAPSSWWAIDSSVNGQANSVSSAFSYGNHSLLDDKMDEPEVAPNHLPGYLTSSMKGTPPGAQSPETPNRANPTLNSSSSWLNNGSNNNGQSLNHSGSFRTNSGLPSPPSTRFGSGGLFDRTSPYNSPRVVNSQPLRVTVAPSQDYAPPTASLEDGDMDSGDIEYSSSPRQNQNFYSSFSQPLQQNTLSTATSIPPPGPSSSSSSLLLTTVTIFGPPSSLLDPLLQHFSQFGEIVSALPDPNGGNWISVTFKTEAEAERAIKHNGEVLGGVWMIGVKWADPHHPSSSRQGLLSPSHPATPSLSTSPSHLQLSSSPKPGMPSTPKQSSSSASTSANGRPIQLAPSNSAFRRLNQTPSSPAVARSSGGGSAMTTVSGSATGTQGSQGGGGIIGKLGELVFGF